MLGKTFNKINIINKALDGAWMKQTTIANNIANVNTPGYKRQTVSFEDALRAELGKAQTVPMTRTHSMHMDPNFPNVPRVENVGDSSYRADDNNVDVDVENAEMAKNTLYYNAMIDRVNGQYNRLKTVFNISK
ncbi:flagellar basal body rod protein FlgB [Fusibacter sp. JL298sf-3]